MNSSWWVVSTSKKTARRFNRQHSFMTSPIHSKTMKPIWILTVAVIAAPLVSLSVDAQESDWRGFRGNQATGVTENVGVPQRIGPTENVAWKLELPGRGPSGPIVLGDRVYVTCSGGDGEDELYICCVDADQGEMIWQRKFLATGRCFCHPLSANAAPTPCTDGESIFAFFSSNDLFCLDLDGNLKWFRGLAVDHPKAGHDTGMSSSPVVHDDILVCQVENQGDSFAIGINKATGETVWEIERPLDASWSSPVILTPGDGSKPLCVLSSVDRATVVDLKTGDVVWEKEGRVNPVPSATVLGDMLFIPIDGTTAVSFDDAGRFEEVWSSPRAAPGSPSNVFCGERFYSVGRGGVLSCFETSSGERLWQARVGGQHWTTPVVADNHMYLFSQDGEASIVNLDEQITDDSERVVHTSKFEDEVFLASPAVIGSSLFMRSDRYLYRFAAQPD